MQVREVANAALKSEAWKRTSRWIRGTARRGPAAGHELDGVRVPAEVVVYFGDDADKIYQVQQWLPVLERLNETHPVVLVFRKLTALRALRWMDDYGKGDDLNELLSRWVMALANAENSRFAQEIDPLTGEPAQVSQWYSSAMLLFLHGVKRLGLA